MGRGKLPTQTPRVPPDSFIAFDLLYRFLQQLDRDLAAVEAGGGGGGGGGGGVTDHGALTGLADDDHLQYHNDARGDARYVQLADDWNYLFLGADHVNSTLVATDIPDLQVTFPGAGNFWIEGRLLVQTANTASVPRLTCYEPNNANGAWIIWETQAATTSLTATGGTGATGNFTAAGTMRNANLPMQAQVDAYYVATAAGTVPWKMGLVSETAGTAVRVLAGSFIRWKQIN